MYRTNTCGELRISDAGKQVTLAGWVQRSRKMGGMTFVDLRDRYGITQLVFNEEVDKSLCESANKLGREYCIQVEGTVCERQSKNANLPTERHAAVHHRGQYRRWRRHPHEIPLSRPQKNPRAPQS